MLAFFFQDHLAAARGSRKWSEEQWAMSRLGGGLQTWWTWKLHLITFTALQTGCMIHTAGFGWCHRMLERMSKGGFDPYCWKTDVVLYYVYLDKDFFFYWNKLHLPTLFMFCPFLYFSRKRKESEIVYIKLQMGFYFSSLQYKYMLDVSFCENCKALVHE